METYVSIPNQTKPKATKMNPLSSSIRYIAIKYLMSETTDENLLRQLTVGQYTYCDSLWSKRWTRSKQKTLNDWLEYMEKCVEMANKPYADSIKWGWDNDRMHDEETDDEEEDDEDDTTGEELFVQMVAEMVGGSPMIATADSRAHEIISHRAKYGNAPLFENNIVFGNFFSREQFEEECAEIPEVGFGIKTHISNYFDEFQEHIHGLGREGHFNELMKEYFEFWLETNQ